MIAQMTSRLKMLKRSKLQNKSPLYSETVYEQELINSRTRILDPESELENELKKLRSKSGEKKEDSILKRSEIKPHLKSHIKDFIFPQTDDQEELIHSITQVIDPLEVLENDINNSEQKSIFYSEPYFHNLVIYETNRAYRLQSAFLLISIDISEMMDLDDQADEKEKNSRSREINKLIKMLYESTREIDIKGWFCENKIIGIICVNAELKKHAELINILQLKLIRTVKKKYGEMIKITGKSFPDEKSTKNKTKVVPIKEILIELYNEAAEKAAAKKNILVVKRAVDILGSLFALILFSPFFILLPILIKLTSKGPVLFKQERVGMDGKPFQFWKFRSMKVNNDDKIHKEFVSKLIKGEIEAKEGEEADAVYKIKDDPRVTKIGKFIRKTSLDELPQFYNVLLGDMSLVGPRPPIAYEVEQYDIWHTRRVISFKPGITGFWQVEGRSSTTFDEMVRMDLRYIKNWSPWLDIKLLLKTPLAVFKTRGAC